MCIIGRSVFSREVSDRLLIRLFFFFPREAVAATARRSRGRGAYSMVVFDFDWFLLFFVLVFRLLNDRVDFAGGKGRRRAGSRDGRSRYK